MLGQRFILFLSNQGTLLSKERLQKLHIPNIDDNLYRLCNDDQVKIPTHIFVKYS